MAAEKKAEVNKTFILIKPTMISIPVAELVADARGNPSMRSYGPEPGTEFTADVGDAQNKAWADILLAEGVIAAPGTAQHKLYLKTVALKAEVADLEAQQRAAVADVEAAKGV